jgi:hypothetical protein
VKIQREKKSANNNNEQQRVQESSILLLLQEVQPSAGRMPNQDPGKPALHGQAMRKILTTKICHGRKTTVQNFADLSFNKFCETTDAKSDGDSTTNLQPLRGFNSHLQQTI